MKIVVSKSELNEKDLWERFNNLRIEKINPIEVFLESIDIFLISEKDAMNLGLINYHPPTS